MPHWRSMTDKETLGAWDLVDRAGKAKDFTLEIARVQRGLVQSREKPKGEHRPFVYFKGASKPLVCNATKRYAPVGWKTAPLPMPELSWSIRAGWSSGTTPRERRSWHWSWCWR